MNVRYQAMHMSDGIVNAPVSVLFAAAALIALGLCAWRAREELDERTVPLAGLVAAFIFAVQMVNFPILPGVSGHLLGGALAAILVGPFTGALCVAIVLVVQSLLFADGGVTDSLGRGNARRVGVADSAGGAGVWAWPDRDVVLAGRGLAAPVAALDLGALGRRPARPLPSA